MTFSPNQIMRRGLSKFPRIERRLRLRARQRRPILNQKAEIERIIAGAKEQYEIMVRQLPENAVPAGVKRDIEHHAHAVWGSRKHAACLLSYTAYHGKFCEGWIPWSYYNEVLVPSLNSPNLIGAKTMSRRFIPGDLVPDLAYFVRGNWSDADNRAVAASDVIDLVFADHDEVYVKTEMGGVGKGVFRHTRDSFAKTDFSKTGNLSIQSSIRQHPFFDSLTDKSVATLRVTTVKPYAEAARSPGSHIRTGIGDSRIVDVKDGIETPIMDDDGTFCRYGSTAASTPNWRRDTHHPDSGLELGTLKMPGFRTAKQLCERLHDTLPHLTIIGWDVVINENGDPKIIEINTKAPGFDGHQLGAGAHFTGFGWEDVWRQ